MPRLSSACTIGRWPALAWVINTRSICSPSGAKRAPLANKAIGTPGSFTRKLMEKTATLDNAQTENWESIRANLTTSWQNLQGALDKARAEVPKA